MAGSRRRESTQSKHDRTVEKIAQDYKDRGYDVSADVGAYARPSTIRGYRPDVLARKRGHETIVEVETPDSVDSPRDKAQQRAFRSAARRSERRHYRRVVSE